MSTMSRRQLLRRLGFAAGAAAGNHLLTACRDLGAPGRTQGASPAQADVIILGAGVAGLCGAYELEKKNIRTILLEADRRHLGGRVRTLRFADGRYGEAGAMRIPRDHKLTRDYCTEMGLTLRPFVQSNPLAYFFVRGTRVRNKDAAQLNALFQLRDNEKNLSSDALWAAGVSSRLKAMSAAEKVDLLSAHPVTDSYRALDRLSLQQLFDNAGLSDEAIELMAVTQGQEAEMQYGCSESLREELKEIWSNQFDEIVGGTDRLPAALARRLRSPIRQGCEVIALQQDAAGVTVTYRNPLGAQETVRGRIVLCTLPLPIVQRLSADFSPDKRRAIRELMYDSATKVLINARRRFWELDDGIYGGGTFTDLPSGSTYYPSDNALDRSGAGPRDPALSRAGGVFLASYSWGMTARRLAAMPHAQRLGVVTRHLARIHPQLNDPAVITSSASWSWDTHPWSGGAFAWFNPGQHTALYGSLIKPEGRIFFAGEHASLTHTWMQGAFESALRCVIDITTTLARA